MHIPAYPMGSQIKVVFLPCGGAQNVGRIRSGIVTADRLQSRLPRFRKRYLLFLNYTSIRLE